MTTIVGCASRAGCSADMEAALGVPVLDPVGQIKVAQALGLGCLNYIVRENPGWTRTEQDEVSDPAAKWR